MVFAKTLKRLGVTTLLLFHITWTPTLIAEENPDDFVHGPSDKSINLGIVIKNPTYTIYRSSALGKRSMRHLSNYLEDHDLPFPKTIIYMNSAGYAFPLYFAIDEYKASLAETYGPFDFFHPFGELRTYVDGQNPYYPTDFIDTSLYLGPVGRRYFSYHDTGIAGGIESFMDVMNLILDPERQPVLFHCFGGMHRTGMAALVLRYIQGGRWIDGPKTKSHNMYLTPAEYEYTKFNPIFFRKHNLEFIREFIHDPRFLELKEKYHEALSEDENLYFGDEEQLEAPDLGDENYAGQDD